MHPLRGAAAVGTYSEWVALRGLLEGESTHGAVMALTLFCQLCREPSEGQPVPVCPVCHRQTVWTTQPIADHSPECWTVEDRRFLRSYRIAAD